MDERAEPCDLPDVADLSPDTALATPAFAMVEFGVSRGLARDSLMTAARLSDAMRADPDARISTFSFVALWRELLVGLPGVVVPVELARALDARALGVVGQVVLRADDLEHAYELNTRFLRLTDTGVTMQRLERAGLVGLAITHRPEVNAMRFPIELMVGVGFRILQHAAGGPAADVEAEKPRAVLGLREVTFAHSAGFPREAYEELFGVPVRFDASESALWFPAEALHVPFAGRDPVVRRYLETHAESMLATLPAAAPPLLAQVREAIVVELATSGAELSRVAKRLAMSVRTLQRRLEESGTSYQQLVDDVRSTMAQALLRDRARSIVDVAFELGYADLKGFYRAFKRWTQATPAEWRART